MDVEVPSIPSATEGFEPSDVRFTFPSICKYLSMRVQSFTGVGGIRTDPSATGDTISPDVRFLLLSSVLRKDLSELFVNYKILFTVSLRSLLSATKLSKISGELDGE